MRLALLYFHAFFFSIFSFASLFGAFSSIYNKVYENFLC